MSEQIIHVARDGAIIDKQLLAEIIKLFDEGTFKPTDHYWMSGMAEWGSLNDLIVKSRTPPPLPKDNTTKPSWMTPPKHLQYGDFDPPATDKQRDYLLCFGVTLPANLTKYDASRWLTLLEENKEACEYRDNLEMKNVLERMNKYDQEGKSDLGFKTFSGYYRSEYNQFVESGDLIDAKESIKTRIDTWHEIIKFYMDAEVDDLSFQCEGFDTHIDVFYSMYEHGKLFKVCPTKKQIKDMLIKLDDESATWDDDTPELLLRRLLEEQSKIQP